MDQQGESNIKCVQCAFQTNKIFYLVKHTNRKHGRKMSQEEQEIAKLNKSNHISIENGTKPCQNEEQYLPVVEPTNSSGIFHQCSICPSKLSSKPGLSRHIRFKHTEGKLFKCLTCNEQFGSDSSLYRHNKKFHDGDPKRLQPKLRKQDVDEVLNNNSNNIQIDNETKAEQNVVEVVNNSSNNSQIENNNTTGQDVDEVCNSVTEMVENCFKCESCPLLFQTSHGLSVHVVNKHNTNNNKETHNNKKEAPKNNKITLNNEEQPICTQENEQAPIHNQNLELNSPKSEIVTRNIEYILPKFVTEPLKCDSCDFSTLYPRSLSVHRIRKSHFEIKHVTKNDHNKTNDQNLSSLKKSKVDTQEKNTYFICSKCPTKFINCSLLVLHSKMKHRSDESASMFKCQKCSLSYKTKKSLLRHSKNTHRKKDGASEHVEPMESSQNAEQHLSVVAPINSSGIFYQCSICLSKLSSKSLLSRHMQLIHTEGKLYKCLTCNEKFGSGSSLYRHNKKFHDVDSGRQEPELTKKEVAVNVKSATKIREDKPVPRCKLCLIDFGSKSSLHRHKLKCHSQTLDKFTNLAVNVKSTTSIRVGKPVPRCKLCLIDFGSKSSRRRHNLKMHSKTLDKLTTLVVNVKSETSIRGDKPVPCCKLCDTNFGSKSSLHRHKLKCHSQTLEKIKTKTQAENCAEDNDDIIQSRNEQEPNEQAYSSKKFACINCGKTFGSSSLLGGHNNQFHQEKETTSAVHVVSKTCENETGGIPSANQDTNFQSKTQERNEKEETVKIAKTYYCNYCEDNFPNKTSKLRHNQKVHSNSTHVSDSHRSSETKKISDITNNKNVGSTSTNGQMFPCNQCDEKFGRNSSRFRHILKVHLISKRTSKFHRSSETRKSHDTSNQQNISPKSPTFPSDGNLVNKSSRFNPKSKNLSLQSPIMYECSHCDVRFMKITSMSEHENNVHGMKERSELAKNLIPSPAMNVSHYSSIERPSSVTNSLEFKCKQCDKQYSYKHNLKRHEQSAH